MVHVDASNIELIADVDLVMDGCDNFATRHVVNDECCRLKKPWVYGACVGACPQHADIAWETACLRCCKMNYLMPVMDQLAIVLALLLPLSIAASMQVRLKDLIGWC